MKNLQTIKKIAVTLMTVAMVFTSLTISAFAAVKTGQIVVKGLEPKVVATFYKIADVTEEGAITRPAAVTTSVIKDLEKPTAEEITKLAGNPTPLGAAVDTQTVADDGNSVTSKALPSGIYLVNFSVASGGNPDYIYNPVVVNVDKDGTPSEFDMTGANYTWKTGEAQAKKSKITFDKVVERDLTKIDGEDKGANAENAMTQEDDAKVNADPKEGLDGNRGDTAAKGETVTFRINTQIPAYADNFFKEATGGTNTTVTKDPGFEIYDTLDGLTLVTNSVNVYVWDGSDYTPLTKNTDYTLTEKAEGVGFEIKFTGKGVFENRGKAIEVRYQATVKDNAERVNFNGDTNTAESKYSRAPGEEPTDGEKRTTYHYKFTINGKIDGNDSRENREVIKVGTDVTGNFVFEESVTGITEEGWKPLNGVKFELFKADAQGNKTETKVADVTSDANGILRGMEQLDAGKYVLVECAQSAQPDDYKSKYSVNQTEIPIEIEAKLQQDGRLESYMVKVNNIIVGNYKKSYGNPSDKGSAKGTETVQTTGTWSEVDGTTVGAGDALTLHKVKVNNEEIKKTVNGQEVDVDDYGVAADIRNSKVGTLPATGGMGTVAFTVGGIVIMLAALFLLFGGKKKKNNN